MAVTGIVGSFRYPQSDKLQTHYAESKSKAVENSDAVAIKWSGGNGALAEMSSALFRASPPAVAPTLVSRAFAAAPAVAPEPLPPAAEQAGEERSDESEKAVKLDSEPGQI